MSFKQKFLIIFILGLVFGLNFDFFKPSLSPIQADNLELVEQEASIRAINQVIPAVVNIIVDDSNKQEQGSGTGFIISPDGLILTNKHVIDVADEKTGEYRIILNSGKKYYAQFIGKDPINDLAILKIFDKNLPYVKLGSSDNLNLGTSVIAIGNALGRYQSSVTKGIVSGLGRNLTASNGSGKAENLNNVIQTDAEINLGNSGGPLINLAGEVVGINVAVDQSGSAIGFAIPIDDAKPVIKSVREIGRIIRPMLGVHYIMLTQEIAEAEKLLRNAGAYVLPQKNADDLPAIVKGSPADKAGIQAGDIIFEINTISLNDKNSLLSIVQRYKPGDKIGLKIQRGNKIIIKIVELGEF